MSYCRMHDKSDVYIIGNASSVGWTCFGCGGFRSRRDLLKHMIAHLRKGDKVPAYATTRLINEIIRNRRKG